MIVGIRETDNIQVPLRDIVQPVVAFAIHMHKGRPIKVTNITDSRLLSSPHETDLHANEDVHIFQLIDGEHVTKMHCVYDNYPQVRRICFETNLRKSQWYGASSVGNGTTVAVPGDHCDVALCCLEVCDLHGYRYAGRIGLVAWPREDEGQCHVSKAEAYEDVGMESSNFKGRVFRTKADDLRAVVIEANASVLSITAVPKVFYERYLSLDIRVDMGSSQHIFEMVPDEKIIGIDYGMGSSDVVAAVRLRTTHRVSQWFGGSVSGEVTWLRCPHPEEQSVCGFFGTKTEGGVHSVGIIVATPTKPVTVEYTGTNYADY